jgi:hypothetical protein
MGPSARDRVEGSRSVSIDWCPRGDLNTGKWEPSHQRHPQWGRGPVCAASWSLSERGAPVGRSRSWSRVRSPRERGRRQLAGRSPGIRAWYFSSALVQLVQHLLDLAVGSVGQGRGRTMRRIAVCLSKWSDLSRRLGRPSCVRQRSPRAETRGRPVRRPPATAGHRRRGRCRLRRCRTARNGPPGPSCDP